MWRSRLLFLLTTVAAVFLIVTYEDTAVGFIMLYILLFIFLFSLCSMLFVHKFIMVEEEVTPKSISKNESVSYRLSLKNRSLFAYPKVELYFYGASLFPYEEQIPSALSLSGRQQWETAVPIVFPYRGEFLMGVEQLWVTDYFGLWKRKLLPKHTSAVTVYPHYDEKFTLPLQGESQMVAIHHDPLQEDYTSVADVRKYTTTDNVRDIHWKLSAKRAEFVVKNYDSFEPTPIVLFLDTRKMSLPPKESAIFQDVMITYVASALQFCLRSHHRVIWIYGNETQQLEELSAPEELTAAFESLARVSFEEGESALGKVLSLSNLQNTILFVWNLDEEVYEKISYLRSGENRITLFYFYANLLPLTEEIEKRLDGFGTLGIFVHKIPVSLGGGEV